MAFRARVQNLGLNWLWGVGNFIGGVVIGGTFVGASVITYYGWCQGVL